MAAGLERLFRPRAIAVVGASRRRGTIAGEVFHNLVSQRFPGAVYPVNPRATVVQSVRAYPRVVDLPEPIDLALLVVPAAQVPSAIDDCLAHGVRALVVITAGFGETGAEGRAIEEALVAKVRAAGARMVGPNCFGVLDTDPVVTLNATFGPTWPPVGSVAFASQSGALGQAILDHASTLGIGVRQFVSLGNRADVSASDLIAHWSADDATKVVLLYLESLGDARAFLDVASRAARRKPIALVKSGRTEAGARAARSHTGALAGREVGVDALLTQSGVLRTDTIEELFDLAMLLSSQPVPRGNRVALVTNAGGPAIMAVDACECRALRVAALAPETEAALRAFLPPEASVKNPVDMIASASAQSYERALRLVLSDPGVDAAIALFVPPLVTEAADVAAAIRRAAEESDKPVVTCFMGTHGISAGVSSLREAHVPSYAFPESAAIALSHAVRYGQWRARPEGVVPAIEGVDAAAAAAHLGGGDRWLTPDEVRAVLVAYGLRTPAEALARNEDEAASAAEAIGFPVAMKLASRTITHKTDVGGVALDLGSADEVRAAYRTLCERLEGAGLAAQMDGVLLQEMVHGVECFVGVTRDASVGPLVGFGIGGVEIEVWRDVVFRVAPVTDVDAKEMLAEIQGRKLLLGFRGAPAVDGGALEGAIHRVSRLGLDHARILEIDVNPLVALPEGRGAVVVDARIRVGGA